MRMAEHGSNTISKETWVKAEKFMANMGYKDATWTGISQRWSKFILKNFQNQYSHVLGSGANGDDAVAPAPALAPAPPPTPGRRGKKRAPQKREREQEEQYENDDEDDESTVEKAPRAKKQKNWA
ncbi:hypothetical protein F5Y12DRAFT_713957 [Xylaria sp. FL1777]|nr:hypothetical protein F5Y12DRAFT_713957 [Xylaria sp. FL1777]